MKRVALLIVVFFAVTGAAATAAFAVPSTASAFPIRECGDLPHTPIQNVTTRGLSCREARGIARAWLKPSIGTNMHERVRPTGYLNQLDVRCTRFRYVVRFQFGPAE